MKSIFYKPPRFVREIFDSFIWESAVDKVLLTFDDGPNPDTTELLLKKLDQYKIKSIFFCVGDNIVKYKSLVNTIISEGHSIGNHTSSHQNIFGRSNKSIENDLNNFNKIMMDEFGYNVNYFRPPHGKFNLNTPKIMSRTGLKNVMWTLLTADYKNDINIVKFSIENYLTNNSIIVFHDSIKSDGVLLNSIDFLMDTIKSKNYEIGAPAECLN